MGRIDEPMAEVSGQASLRIRLSVTRDALESIFTLGHLFPPDARGCHTDWRFAGPVTDYTSSMVQSMRHRQPKYKGGARMEMERPSASYIVDVRSLPTMSQRMLSSPLIHHCY